MINSINQAVIKALEGFNIILCLKYSQELEFIRIMYQDKQEVKKL